MEEEKFERVDKENIYIASDATYKRTPEFESFLADIALQVETICRLLQKEVDNKLEEITSPDGLTISEMTVKPDALKALVNDAVGLVFDTFKCGFGFEAYKSDKKMNKLLLAKIEKCKEELKSNEE